MPSSTDTSDFELRRLVPADAPEVARLRAEMLVDTPVAFWGSPDDDGGVDPEIVAGRLEPGDNASFGAFDRGRGGLLVSFAGFVRETRRKLRHKGSIVSVYTSPVARRNGLSARLIHMILDHARSLDGLAVVQLGVSAETLAAKTLYEKMGFVAWGREVGALSIDGVLSDDIYMSLWLDSPPD